MQYHANASELGGYAAFEAILANGGLRRLEGSDGGTPSVEAIYRKAGPNKIPFEVGVWGTSATRASLVDSGPPGTGRKSAECARRAPMARRISG